MNLQIIKVVFNIPHSSSPSSSSLNFYFEKFWSTKYEMIIKKNLIYGPWNNLVMLYFGWNSFPVTYFSKLPKFFHLFSSNLNLLSSIRAQIITISSNYNNKKEKNLLGVGYFPRENIPSGKVSDRKSSASNRVFWKGKLLSHKLNWLLLKSIDEIVDDKASNEIYGDRKPQRSKRRGRGKLDDQSIYQVRKTWIGISQDQPRDLAQRKTFVWAPNAIWFIQ